MVPASGIRAVYRGTRVDGLPYEFSTRVHYWSEDGVGLVLDERSGLVAASDDYLRGSFLRYDDSPDLVAVVPALPGTSAVFWSNDDPKDLWRQPVIAWAVDAEGFAKPIYRSEDDSYCFYADEKSLRRVELPGETSA